MATVKYTETKHHQYEGAWLSRFTCTEAIKYELCRRYGKISVYENTGVCQKMGKKVKCEK